MNANRVKLTVCIWLMFTMLCCIWSWYYAGIRLTLGVACVLTMIMIERIILVLFILARYDKEFDTVGDLRNRIITLEKERWELKRENDALHISSKKLQEDAAVLTNHP